MSRPSSLPFLAKCPCWKPLDAHGETDKNDGTLRHDYHAELLREWIGSSDPLKAAALKSSVESARKLLSDDDADAVEWSVEYVKVHCPISDEKLEIEHHVNPLDANFNPLFPNGGTLDAACGNQLFDFKWRERDYLPQFAAYVIARCQDTGCASVRCHALYGCSKRVSTFTLTESQAMDIVTKIISASQAPDRKPTPREYCSWCSECYRCPPFLAAAKAASIGAHGEFPMLDVVKHWHPSLMDTAEEISAAVTIWRTLLKKWGESVDYHALEYVKTHGAIPGYELGTKTGKSYITDAAAAFALCGLPQEEFLRACQPRLETSKTYPDQVGLVQLYKSFAKIEKTAPAKRALLAKLEPVIKKTKDSIILKSIKSNETETD